MQSDSGIALWQCDDDDRMVKEATGIELHTNNFRHGEFPLSQSWNLNIRTS
jgi:hypothetical protein